MVFAYAVKVRVHWYSNVIDDSNVRLLLPYRYKTPFAGQQLRGSAKLRRELLSIYPLLISLC